MAKHQVSEEYSANNVAVFTSDAFDHPAQYAGPIEEVTNEQYPVAGLAFAVALERAFAPETTQRDQTDAEEPCWEHGGWIFWLEHEGKSYSIDLWPMPTAAPLWKMRVEESHGCLIALLGGGSLARIPRSLQARLQLIVEQITKTTDFRWTTEEKALAML